jgi:O-antigen ligase
MMMRINDTLANKISFYHVLLLMASLPFDRFYSHIILISFAVHSLIQLNYERFRSVFQWRTLVLQSIFFITLTATIYSVDKPAALNEWTRELPILFIPVVFALSGFNFARYRKPLLFGFSLVCTATILYLYWDAWHTIRHYKLPLSTLFTGAFTNHNFSQPIDMHATFLSMQLVIALVYLLTQVIEKGKTRDKVIYSLCSAVLLAGLIQLCSKSIFVCLFIVIEVVLPVYMLKDIRRIRFIIGASIASIIVLVCIFSSGTFRARYFDELRLDFTHSKPGETTEPRLARWSVAGDLIMAAPVIGHGTGSEMGLLHEEFFKRKYYSSFINHLNAHNQYLSFLIQSGLVGLIIYLLTLGYGFNSAIAKKDLLFLTFMLLLTIVSISEDYLAADKGVCFYAIFFSFFAFSDEKKPVETTPKIARLTLITGNQSVV